MKAKRFSTVLILMMLVMAIGPTTAIAAGGGTRQIPAGGTTSIRSVRQV